MFDELENKLLTELDIPFHFKNENGDKIRMSIGHIITMFLQHPIVRDRRNDDFDALVTNVIFDKAIAIRFNNYIRRQTNWTWLKNQLESEIYSRENEAKAFLENKDKELSHYVFFQVVENLYGEDFVKNNIAWKEEQKKPKPPIKF